MCIWVYHLDIICYVSVLNPGVIKAMMLLNSENKTEQSILLTRI